MQCRRRSADGAQLARKRRRSCDHALQLARRRRPGAARQRRRSRGQALGADATVAVGNGRNDRLMLKEAALGISVILEEGAAVETVMSGDVVCRSVLDAFDLLLNPLRLVATLRS